MHIRLTADTLLRQQRVKKLLPHLPAEADALQHRDWEDLYHVLCEWRHNQTRRYSEKAILAILRSLQTGASVADLPYLNGWLDVVVYLWTHEEGEVAKAAELCLPKFQEYIQALQRLANLQRLPTSDSPIPPDESFSGWGNPVLRAEDYSPAMPRQRAALLTLQHLAGTGLFVRDRHGVCLALRDETPDRSVVYLGHHRHEEAYLIGLGFQPPFDIWYRAKLEQERFGVEPVSSVVDRSPSISEEMIALDRRYCQAARVVCAYLFTAHELPDDFDLSVFGQADEYLVGVDYLTFLEGSGSSFRVDYLFRVSLDFSLLARVPSF
jgi:hypothetical protein